MCRGFPRLLGGERFDVIYSFFGPLNTEPDLAEAARVLAEVVAPGGVLVLTFVNRLYALDSALHLLRGHPGRAVARLSNRWRGYSDATPLDARLYFPNQIRDVFAPRFESSTARGSRSSTRPGTAPTGSGGTASSCAGCGSAIGC